MVALFYHLGHIGEVLRNCRSVLLDNQVVVTDDVLQKTCVVWQMLQKWLKLLAVLLVFQILSSFDH